ncbi:MAG: cation-transporting P-type ATPase, partial [Vagococcus sp.]
MSQMPIESVFGKYDSSKSGVSNQQASDLREEYGENVISHTKKTPLIVQILKAYFTPFTIVLIILAIISFMTDYVLVSPAERDLTGVIIIVVMVTLSGTMTLIQSVKSNNAAEKLGNLVKVTATVVRKGKEDELPIEELVCGDVIKLSAGDMIPADIRLFQTKDLFVSQAAMTGESYPVEKKAHFEVVEHSSETDLENIAYMGSNVGSGSAL